MKIILGNFNAKVGRENIFKPAIGNESLHQDSNDNGVRIVNFAMEYVSNYARYGNVYETGTQYKQILWSSMKLFNVTF
jgi:hypothetical protein